MNRIFNKILKVVFAINMFLNFSNPATAEEGIFQIYAEKNLLPEQFVTGEMHFTGFIIIPDALKVLKGANKSAKNVANLVVDDKIICIYNTGYNNSEPAQDRPMGDLYKFVSCNNGALNGDEIKVQDIIQLKFIGTYGFLFDYITLLAEIKYYSDGSNSGSCLQGPKGDQGEVGPMGPQGLQGDKGEQGIAGAIGLQGLQGEKGDKGEQGIAGVIGLQGLQGEKGDKGEQGIAGVMGLQGIQGEKGDKGEQGIAGVMGLQGIQGEKGEKGDRGEIGSQGIRGEKGDQGVIGLQGEKGERGDQGEAGMMGPIGPQGEKGDLGPAGQDATAFFQAGNGIVGGFAGFINNNDYISVDVGTTPGKIPQIGIDGKLAKTIIPTMYDGRVCYIKDVKAQGTNGGSFTSGDENGKWGRQRNLTKINTEGSYNGGACSFATLSTNQITLQPGVYKIRAEAPAGNVNNHQARFYNAETGAVVLIGTSEIVDNKNFYQTNKSIIMGQIFISSETTFELRHKCSSTYGTYGFGIAAAFGDEVYSQIEITKVQ